MLQHTAFAAHTFADLESASFDPVTYSHLKFGSDLAGRSMGRELADLFFERHADVLLANRAVVIPSPYNVVPNAATVLTRHMCNRLNHHLVQASGEHVDESIIHRKVSYTNDYGFLSKERRRGLIDNDSFYLNRKYLKGKVLVFVDDVRITGTHEEKLVEILEGERIKNQTFFLYFADYQGEQADIEGALNFAGVKGLDDYLELTRQPGHHLIVRPIKYLLGQPPVAFKGLLGRLDPRFLEALYHGALGEGYYRIPQYQDNVQTLAMHVNGSTVRSRAVA